MRIGRFLFRFHTVVYSVLIFCRAPYVIVILFCYLLTSPNLYHIANCLYCYRDDLPGNLSKNHCPRKNSLLTSSHQKKIKPLQSLSSLGPQWKQCINIT